MSTTYPFWDVDNADLVDIFVGKSVVSSDVKTGTLKLSDGSSVRIDLSNESCCSGIDLAALASSTNIITAAEFRETYVGREGEGEYTASIYVVTEAGELNLATADGNASNGYYLHGFALDITVTPPVKS